MINWEYDIVPRVKKILETRRQQGVPTATLRGIFYILVSEGLIENLPQPYKSLSSALVTARRKKIIPYEWITDENRAIIDIQNDLYYPPKRIIDNTLQSLVDSPTTYKDQIPRWYKQPEYVEVWVEKNAMAGVMSSILTESRQVRIVPNGGWSSETFHHDNFLRLKVKKNVLDTDLIDQYPDEPLKWSTGETREVTVLYYGDYDPTGSKMVKNLERDLKAINVSFERVAITKEQIAEFHLEHLASPDSLTEEVREKLERDKNTMAFRLENEGNVFQIELDALNALMPEDFIAMLEGNVDKHFDESIHKKVLEDKAHSAREIRRLVRKQLKKFKI